MQIIHVGNKSSMRGKYFDLACKSEGCFVEFVDYEDLSDTLLKGAVKIDPLETKESLINEHQNFIDRYENYLEYINSFDKLNLLNTVDSIKLTLDKKKTKRILNENCILTTPMIDSHFNCFDDLYDYLENNNIRKVFIKLNKGSGAGGIIALSVNFRCNDFVIYTTIKLNNGIGVNSKQVFRIGCKKKCKEYIDYLLQYDTIIEKWIEKDRHNSISYDLRVVYQFNQINYIVARGSSTPITNIHLNNNAINIEELNITKQMYEDIEDVCLNTMQCLNLNSAGIDILVKPNKEIMVIEVNAQGDCIYNDMRGNNIIYRNQVRYLNE